MYVVINTLKRYTFFEACALSRLVARHWHCASVMFVNSLKKYRSSFSHILSFYHSGWQQTHVTHRDSVEKQWSIVGPSAFTLLNFNSLRPSICLMLVRSASFRRRVTLKISLVRLLQRWLDQAQVCVVKPLRTNSCSLSETLNILPEDSSPSVSNSRAVRLGARITCITNFVSIQYSDYSHSFKCQ